MKKYGTSKIFCAKPILYFALTLLFIPLLASSASARHAETQAGWAANGIASSMHNLSTSGPYIHNPGAGEVGGSAITTGKGTTEMCVYCHTPHFAERGDGPLWNRNIRGGTVENYGTTIAKNDDGNANMFSTIACLSCHDGVTTFDDIINQPGKDIGNVGGLDHGGTGNAWRFSMPRSGGLGSSAKSDHFAGLAVGSHGGAATCPVCHEDGAVMDVDINRLVIGEQDGGTNLTNDHPIGVLYRGIGDANASASLRARNTIISSINMDIETENGAPMPALVSGNLWAVKGFISDTATIQDLLRSGTGQGSGNYVQCTSCHDPHFKNTTNPETWFYKQVRKLGSEGPYYSSGVGMTPVATHDAFEVNGLFLRRVGGNSDSGLCRTCHDKS